MQYDSSLVKINKEANTSYAHLIYAQGKKNGDKDFKIFTMVSSRWGRIVDNFYFLLYDFLYTLTFP